MNKTTLFIALALTMLPLAGCIDAAKDLVGDDAANNSVEPATIVDPADMGNNTTDEAANVSFAPPVARITLFGDNGALLYKAPFQAEDETAPLFTNAGVQLRMLASDSEALEPGAELVSFAWTIGSESFTGRSAETTLEEPGVYPIMLHVTDSNGESDMQHLTVAIAPVPFDVETTITTTPVAGANGEGVAGTASVRVMDEVDGKPVKPQRIEFTTRGGAACDPIIQITSPDGNSTEPQDTGSQETVSLSEPAPGEYVVTLTGFACVAPEGVPVDVVITYLEIVTALDGVAGGDGHGHAH